MRGKIQMNNERMNYIDELAHKWYDSNGCDKINLHAALWEELYNAFMDDYHITVYIDCEDTIRCKFKENPEFDGVINDSIMRVLRNWKGEGSIVKYASHTIKFMSKDFYEYFNATTFLDEKENNEIQTESYNIENTNESSDHLEYCLEILTDFITAINKKYDCTSKINYYQLFYTETMGVKFADIFKPELYNYVPSNTFVTLSLPFLNTFKTDVCNSLLDVLTLSVKEECKGYKDTLDLSVFVSFITEYYKKKVTTSSISQQRKKYNNDVLALQKV